MTKAAVEQSTLQNHRSLQKLLIHNNSHCKEMAVL